MDHVHLSSFLLSSFPAWDLSFSPGYYLPFMATLLPARAFPRPGKKGHLFILGLGIFLLVIDVLFVGHLWRLFSLDVTRFERTLFVTINTLYALLLYFVIAGNRDAREAGEVLAGLEEKFKQLSERFPFAYFSLDAEGRIVEANPVCLALLGYASPAEVLGRHAAGFLPPAYAAAFEREYEKLKTRGEVKGREAAIRSKDGRTIDISFSGKVRRDDRGHIIGASYVMYDISERKSYERQLKELSLKLFLTEERERRRLATHLHDSLGQLLALSKLKLTRMRAADMGKDARTLHDETLRLIEESIEYTRSLTFELGSPVLRELGLVPAVGWFAGQVAKQYGFSCTVKSEGSDRAVQKETAAVLFRAVRELFMNVIKHSNARNVSVRIAGNERALTIDLEDDGDGFDMAKLIAKGGYGLPSVRESIECLQGTFKVDSRLHGGTRIHISVPVRYRGPLNENTGGSAS